MSAINAEVWRRIDECFQIAADLDPERQSAFLDKACAGEPLLRNEVEALLTSDSEEWELIEMPAIEAAAILLVDEQPQLTAGQQIGHYEIEELIGRGGMGQVYLARDRVLKRSVALKFLSPDYTQSETRLERFKREAETISALNHPNIITIHELGSDDDHPFIATEFVEGETLRERLRRGALSVNDAIDVTIQTANALAAAHRAGIVHRDIKPENIMLRSDGYVKILDFGLAKLAEIHESHQLSTGGEQTEISSGVLLGTLRYMSPEQVRGLPADGRSDIFSLGLVLYEILTGRPAFAHKEPEKLAQSILNDEPARDRSIPKKLVPLIAKMLQKVRDERYQTVDELIVQLRSLQDGPRRTFGSQKGAANEKKLARSAIAAVLFLTVVSMIAFASYRYLRGYAVESPPDTGKWAAKAPISSPRYQVATAVLNDTLYAAGGWEVCTAFGDLEAYDPATNTWAQRSKMGMPRGGHGLAALDGKLYAVGGNIDCRVPTASMESYDPLTDRWTPEPPLPYSRYNHSVAAANGKLYVIGGHSSTDSRYLRLNTEYDPATRTWTERAPLQIARSAAAVAVLNGIIYVMGGSGEGSTLSSVEAYDPATDTWTVRSSMRNPRVSFAASDLNGTVYVMGGTPPTRDVEAYDPRNDTWLVVSEIPKRREGIHAATLRGSIYFVGGQDGTVTVADVSAFTPPSEVASDMSSCASLSVLARAPLPSNRSGLTVGALNGRIYAAGGWDNRASYVGLNEVYDPSFDRWEARAPMSVPRETVGTNNAVVAGKLYVIGGNASGYCSDVNETYDPVSDTWTRKSPMPTARCHLAVVALDRMIYAIGGTNTSGSMKYATVEVYDPANDTWTTAAPMPSGRMRPAAAVLNGMVYVIGGVNPALSFSGVLDIVEAYDPRTGAWTTEAPMNHPRVNPAAGLLDGRLVVMSGGPEAKGTAEVYAPTEHKWLPVAGISAVSDSPSSVSFGDKLIVIGANFGAPAIKPPDSNLAIELVPCTSP